MSDDPIDKDMMPSSDNDSTLDYGDRDGYDILHPQKFLPVKEISRSSSTSISPIKLRMISRIRKILPDDTDEYIELLSEIYYQWKRSGKKYPKKYDPIIKYIDSRV